MKKRFCALILAGAGVASVFAGCSGCAGCGANGKTNEAAFSSNWYADTNFGYIQPTFTFGDKDFKGAEEIVYDVTFDGESAANPSYSIEYGPGTFTTYFCAAEFDKSLIDGEYREEYPDSKKVYCYRTERSLRYIRFKMKSGEEKSFDEEQKLVTECYFTDVANHLRPLYSVQDIKTVIPAEYQTGNIEAVYTRLDLRYETSYRYDGSAAKTVVYDRLDGNKKTEKAVGGLNDTNNSLIDVGGINIAARAMQLNSAFTQAVSLYSPAGGMQEYTFTGAAGSLGEEERTAAENMLAGKGLYVGGEGRTLETTCVTVKLNADLTGVSQRYWFAAVGAENAKNNRSRATLVKMSEPLTFGLGTLNYSLKEIKSTIY